MSVEAAKAYLQKDNGKGENLFDHLSDALLKVLESQPADAVDAFEQIAAQARNAAYASQGDGAEEAKAADDAGVAGADYAKRASALFSENTVTSVEGEDDEVAEKDRNAAQDFASDANLLAWGGVGFGATESFRVHLALKEIGDGVTSARLWGKIQGTGGDYIVAECEADVEEEEGREGAEGANKYTYYVCSEAGSKWTKLPHVTPAQIGAARKLRKFLSGSLDAEVTGYPPFPGNEAGLLRATIALISSSCALIPAGALNEEGGEAEEYEAGGLDAVEAAGGWEHAVLGLDAVYGRCTAPMVANDEGEEEPAADFEERGWNTGANEEEWAVSAAPVSGGTPSCAVLKSTVYPGYVVAASSASSYAQLYVGYGTRASSSPYTPPLPPPVQSEFAGELKEAEDVTEDPAPQEDEAE